jgi:aminoglycoside 6-adenylyltransferase
MRDEATVLRQVSEWAESAQNIRTVILTSSRADPLSHPDMLSDYDLQVFVHDLEPITRDDQWLQSFGAIMVRWPLSPQSTSTPGWITQLVVLEDGVRIDFQFTEGKLPRFDEHDHSYTVLGDKDHLADAWPNNSFATPIERPSAEAFLDRTNAFWWDILYVAKGLWRGELNYAKYILDGTIRYEKLLPVLRWHIGLQHGWETRLGLHDRWLHRYLDPPTWDEYLQTFADAQTEANWSALLTTTRLFRRTAQAVAAELGCEYPDQTDKNVTAFIEHIRTSPPGVVR